jgi:hypothetical protein
MHKVVRILAVLVCAYGLSGVSAVAAARRAPLPAEVSAQRAPAPARTLPSAQAAEYAAREAAARDLEKFKGGGGVDIYIGGTALAIVLLVVILVLLI